MGQRRGIRHRQAVRKECRPDEKSELHRALEKPNVRTGGGKRRKNGSLFYCAHRCMLDYSELLCLVSERVGHASEVISSLLALLILEMQTST